MALPGEPKWTKLLPHLGSTHGALCIYQLGMWPDENRLIGMKEDIGRRQVARDFLQK